MAFGPYLNVESLKPLPRSYSRSKVKFNVHRSDNMIINAISLLDQIDKDLNTFAMRVKEWYSWHFPELVKIVSDNYTFARLAKAIKVRKSVPGKILLYIDLNSGQIREY